MDTCFICGEIIDIDDDRDVYQDRYCHHECLIEFLDSNDIED